MENLGIGMDLFGGIFKGKKVLVTGDSGFKGSWMCLWLKALGADVYGYSLPPKTPADNFVTTGLASRIYHQDGDIRDLDSMKSFFRKVNPDFAFHLAAQALVIQSYDNPVETFSSNLMGTVHFFECVRATPSVRVAVNISSDKCYDNKEWVWGYRENDPMGGKDPYSASKGCAELIFNSYLNSFFNRSGACAVASGRAGNVIGGGDWAENRIIPDVFRAVQQNKPVEVRNPHSTRPWQFVLEPVFGYMKLAEKLWNSPSQYQSGWNFGPLDNHNYSVGQLLEKVQARIPSLEIQSPQLTEKPHEAHLLKLDISKAVTQLNWRPLLNFHQTVEFTVQGYLDELTPGKDLYEARLAQIEAYSQNYFIPISNDIPA
ncbi:MAG TPA: CDP-glucose 4,6-dehydratase [Catalimonadaceae bacterium]|nr:CDP-glucose 4,6-dehydratase [Catalimonadaceae bacterium]